jgi:hypothetical protein
MGKAIVPAEKQVELCNYIFLTKLTVADIVKKYPALYRKKC